VSEGRRARLRGAACALAFGAAACGRDAPPVQRVILITCDTLRADRLGAYGYERDTSPHLDAFARRALVFDEAYASAPMTQPALSSLMTGRLPHEVGAVPGNRSLMPPDAWTLAEVLSEAGVETAAVVSNWVLRRRDEAREGAGGEVGLAQGFAHYDDAMREREKNRPVFERDAAGTTDAALAWLEGRGPGERFFLWVHYQDPHGPYEPPASWLERFLRGSDPHTLPAAEFGQPPGHIPAYQVLGEERRPGVYMDRYDAEIGYFDAELGRLLDELSARELFEDALIVFSSDHGESLGERDLWFSHGENVQRELVRVPLIVSAPPSVSLPGPRIGRTPALAGHVDLFATILDAFGVEAPPSRGVSLLSPELPERVLVQQVVPPPNTAANATAVSDGRWRLVWNENEPPRLYDVRADPGETRDVSALEPATVESLLARWRELERDAGPVLEGRAMQLDERDEAALHALGYTGGEDDSKE